MIKKIIFLLLAGCILCQLAGQEFDVKKFSDPEKYDWKTPEEQAVAREDLLQRQKLMQLYNMRYQSVWQNVLKSAVTPGWGHFSTESYTKGEVLLCAQVVLAGASWFFYDKAMDKYDKYKEATQVEEMNGFYSDAQTPYRLAQGFLGLLALVWVYTLYDTAMVTEEYNGKLWDEIVKDSGYKRVHITPNGISVRF